MNRWYHITCTSYDTCLFVCTSGITHHHKASLHFLESYMKPKLSLHHLLASQYSMDSVASRHQICDTLIPSRRIEALATLRIANKYLILMFLIVFCTKNKRWHQKMKNSYRQKDWFSGISKTITLQWSLERQIRLSFEISKELMQLEEKERKMKKTWSSSAVSAAWSSFLPGSSNKLLRSDGDVPINSPNAFYNQGCFLDAKHQIHDTSMTMIMIMPTKPGERENLSMSWNHKWWLSDNTLVTR